MYNEDQMFLRIAKWAVGSVLALVVLFGSIGTVGAGERGVKTRLGAITGEVVEPGLYFKFPFIEKVNIIEVKTQTISFEKGIDEKGNAFNKQLSAASKDLQDVGVAVVVNYHIEPSQVKNIYQQYRDVQAYQARVLEPRVSDIVKSVSPQYTAEELITKRSDFNSKVTSLLVEEIQKKDSVSEQVNITNIEFSPSFTQSIEAKVTAQQNAEKAKNDLVRIQYEAQQKVETAKGEAESIKIQSQALTEQPQYIQKLAIEKWNGVLPQYITEGATTPFVNINK